jgi:hypothetical protein
MSHIDPSSLARATIDERLRVASRQRLAREFRRSERASTESTAASVSTVSTATPTARSHSRVWRLVHFRQAAYS